MKLNNLIVHESSKFFYDAKTKKFVTELSDLNVPKFMGRIYDDACDMGFVMKSARTGKELLFYFIDTDRNREDEIEGYRFCSEDGKFTALLIND